MKKVLLATSALMLVAGAAAAEVKVSGKGRMGVVYDGNDAVFSSRIRIIFDASGESDSGLSFGASVRNDQSGVGNDVNDDSTVWVSGAFGKVTMGDTGNASDSLLGQVSGVGYTGLGDMNEIGFLSRDLTGAEYDYTSGAFAFSLGLGQTVDTNGKTAGVAQPGPTYYIPDDDGLVSAAVKYSADAYAVGLAYEDNNSGSQVTVTGSATFGAATVKAKIVETNLDSAVYTADPDTQWALSVDYKANDALTLTAYAANAWDGKVPLATMAPTANTDRYGVGASYDLGGGASLVGGVARMEGTDTVADLGLTFAF